MLRSIGKSLVVIVACAASGCSSFVYDCVDDTFTGFHDHLEAKRAWRRCQGCYYEVAEIGDFREGFIAGYLHMLNGGGCCRPTLPPRKYWSLCTRGEANHCRIVAWYNGWDSGVAQAQHDGMGSGPLTTANDIYGTSRPYPVELPEDLRRPADQQSELVPPGQQLFPLGDQFLPPVEGTSPSPKDTPPAAPYNPPALPLPEAPLPETPVPESQAPVPVKGSRVAPDDALTPPAPPRPETVED